MSHPGLKVLDSSSTQFPIVLKKELGLVSVTHQDLRGLAHCRPPAPSFPHGFFLLTSVLQPL